MEGLFSTGNTPSSLVERLNPNKDFVTFTFFLFLELLCTATMTKCQILFHLFPGLHSSAQFFPLSCHQSEPPQLIARLVCGLIFSKKLVDRFGGLVLNYKTSLQEFYAIL